MPARCTWSGSAETSAHDSYARTRTARLGALLAERRIVRIRFGGDGDSASRGLTLVRARNYARCSGFRCGGPQHCERSDRAGTIDSGAPIDPAMR
ncbi:MAG TPA: hypothetical protein DCQ98_14840 [Planctomycetaceae bacterium]|nr:hypothetical protein [Planctomycetaceae bacterium]